MHPARTFRPSLSPAILALVLAIASPARAVVIQTVSGTDNTTPPADDPGFANVGSTANGLGTAIYLGAGWVLTAGHVSGSNGIVLASGTYLQASGTDTGFTLVNNAPGKTDETDLYMYKLATEPVGLPTLAIASSMPAIDERVVMVGGGRDRGTLTQWGGGEYEGYTTLSSRAIRWGENTVASNDLWEFDGLDVKSFITVFDKASGTFEAQAVVGDSGGAVFTKTGGQWQLAGVIYAVGPDRPYPSPVFNAVFGDFTASADLSYYRPQIVSMVPEPTAAALAGIVAVCLVWMPVPRARRPRVSGSTQR